MTPSSVQSIDILGIHARSERGIPHNDSYRPASLRLPHSIRLPRGRSGAGSSDRRGPLPHEDRQPPGHQWCGGDLDGRWFVQRGLVRQARGRPTGEGRRGVIPELNPGAGGLLSIDMGASHVTMLLTTLPRPRRSPRTYLGLGGRLQRVVVLDEPGDLPLQVPRERVILQLDQVLHRAMIRVDLASACGWHRDCQASCVKGRTSEVSVPPRQLEGSERPSPLVLRHRTAIGGKLVPARIQTWASSWEFLPCGSRSPARRPLLRRNELSSSDCEAKKSDLAS
jgi:hypothetical protein